MATVPGPDDAYRQTRRWHDRRGHLVGVHAFSHEEAASDTAWVPRLKRDPVPTTRDPRDGEQEE